jgi:hypothetical protein
LDAITAFEEEIRKEGGYEKTEEPKLATASASASIPTPTPAPASAQKPKTKNACLQDTERLQRKKAAAEKKKKEAEAKKENAARLQALADAMQLAASAPSGCPGFSLCP